MKKLRILCDMDDVMENLLETWISFLNEKHGTKVTPDEITEWDMTKAFPSIPINKIFSPLTLPEFWDKVKPVQDAQLYIKNLIDEGHDFVVVTASHPDSVSVKLKRVLYKHFPFIDKNNVVITNRKQLVKGDVLIDDAPHNLIGGEYKCILMDAPHNKMFKAEGYGMIRVRNWEEIYNTISELSQRGEDFWT